MHSETPIFDIINLKDMELPKLLILVLKFQLTSLGNFFESKTVDSGICSWLKHILTIRRVSAEVARWFQD